MVTSMTFKLTASSNKSTIFVRVAHTRWPVPSHEEENLSTGIYLYDLAFEFEDFKVIRTFIKVYIKIFNSNLS